MNYFQSHIGEIAALLVSFSWTGSALFFEKAGKHIGSLQVNIIRLFLAIFFLGITTLFTRGLFFPIDATAFNWMWLALSGIVGFFIGDLALFKSYSVIGARTASLIMSLHPMITAVIGWIFLNEVLSIRSIIAVFVSLSGIMIVVFNKNMKLNIPFKGFLLAFTAALGQAVGLILSKKGIGDYDPIAATQIRAIFGFICFAVFVTVLGRWGKVKIAVENPEGVKATAIGTVFGPFVGVSLSLFAVQHTQTGIASTLMALVPVLIIFPSSIMFKEKITARQVIGAVISIIGVSLFFY
ncbi:MAG: DMT family transporter [Paludibacteraceae bacterium]